MHDFLDATFPIDGMNVSLREILENAKINFDVLGSTDFGKTRTEIAVLEYKQKQIKDGKGIKISLDDDIWK